MTNILSFIQTQLQTRLNAATTLLRTVGVIDTNAMERPREAYTDAQTLLVIYRELSSILPDMPVRDRTINGVFTVIALESEKTVVKTIIDDFIETYNATLQGNIIMRFTTLVPLGSPTNIGAKMMQEWSFGFVGVIADTLNTLWDKSITVTSITYVNVWNSSLETYWNAQVEGNRATETNVGGVPISDASEYALGFAMRVSDGVLPTPNYAYFVVAETLTPDDLYDVYHGLVNFTFSKMPVYAEYPTSALSIGKVFRYTKYSLQFVVIDNGDNLLSDFVYGSTRMREFTITDGVNSITLNLYITQATDSATGNGFSVKTIFAENG
jgi:hypothetical protein